jgi:hypothetical protein
MGLVRALQPMKIHRRIAGIIRRWWLACIYSLKFFNPAHASNSVPSTLKCSSDIKSKLRACSTTRWKNLMAISAFKKRLCLF